MIQEADIDDLQVNFARRSPVLVFGPGCHRVRYDQGLAWEGVKKRVTAVWHEIDRPNVDGLPKPGHFDDHVEDARGFLQRFWLSKLSDETIDEYTNGFADGRPHESLSIATDEPPDDTEPECTALATSLLGTLFESTRCLGFALSSASSPVTSWESVSHPGLLSCKDPEDAKAAAVARKRAQEHLERVVDLARYLDRLQRGETLTEDDKGVRDSHGLPEHVGKIPGALNRRLRRTKIEAVRHATKELRERLAKGDSSAQLTGGVVEWLASLFWHVVVAHSKVPPSQSEIAFYLNLSKNERHDKSAYRRWRPGEAGGPLGPETLAGDIRGLLQSYDCGLEPWDRREASTRIELASTLAATLVQMWRSRTKGFGAVPIVALVTDFDLVFERCALEAMKPGEKLHLVVPVWKTENKSAAIDWLFTTLKRESGTIESEQLTDIENWQWYKRPIGDSEDFELEGPVIFKLNGSPLINLAPEQSLLGKEVEQVTLATVFTEFESLQALISFAEIDQGNKSIHEEVITTLNWKVRSWMFFGDSLPDWLPRLRLLYSARDAWAGQAGNDKVVHIAVDRKFDWPETFLLDELGVRRLPTDLATVATYNTAETDPRDDDADKTVDGFLNGVTNILSYMAK